MNMLNKKLTNCSLNNLVKEIENCCKCEICKSITNKVPWEGTGSLWLMFVWEAPWKQEDILWRPFVWPAGKILTELIENILWFSREEVFITSVLKCRPPNNRDPKNEEIMNCFPFLIKQIKCLDPRLIVALWRFAARTLIWKKIPMKEMRWKLFTDTKVNRSVFVVFHPAAVIYNPNLKVILEEDFKKLKKLLWCKN